MSEVGKSTRNHEVCDQRCWEIAVATYQVELPFSQVRIHEALLYMCMAEPRHNEVAPRAKDCFVKCNIHHKSRHVNTLLEWRQG